MFELDGERREAPEGTFVFVPPGVKRTTSPAARRSPAGTDDAIEHLRHAADRSEELRAYAKEDSDFDPIRDEPAFKEIVGT
jgi:hypothetical protein